MKKQDCHLLGRTAKKKYYLSLSEKKIRSSYCIGYEKINCVIKGIDFISNNLPMQHFFFFPSNGLLR